MTTVSIRISVKAEGREIDAVEQPVTTGTEEDAMGYMHALYEQFRDWLGLPPAGVT